MNRGFQSIKQILFELVHPEGRAEEEREVKDQLEALIAQMYSGNILYSEAVREFKKKFILHVLKTNRWNQVKAAREMGMHRNTLSRAILELKLDVRQLRDTRPLRRPAASVPNVRNAVEAREA
jgi:DNA-binding NtrC family response regulator